MRTYTRTLYVKAVPMTRGTFYAGKVFDTGADLDAPGYLFVNSAGYTAWMQKDDFERLYSALPDQGVDPDTRGPDYKRGQ